MHPYTSLSIGCMQVSACSSFFSISYNTSPCPIHRAPCAGDLINLRALTVPSGGQCVMLPGYALFMGSSQTLGVNVHCFERQQHTLPSASDTNQQSSAFPPPPHPPSPHRFYTQFAEVPPLTERGSDTSPQISLNFDSKMPPSGTANVCPGSLAASGPLLRLENVRYGRYDCQDGTPLVHFWDAPSRLRCGL